MTKSILALCGLLLFVSCKDEKHAGNLHITGNIEGLKQGTLYIKKISDTSWVSVDTIKINGDSHFESYLDIQSPEMYYLMLDRGATSSIDDNLPFFAEPGNMTINTTLDRFYFNAKITGSKNQKLYEEYKKINARFTDENTTLVGEKLRAKKLNKPERVDSIEKLQEKITIRKYNYTSQFALNNRDFEIAPYVVLTEINDVNLKYLDTIQKSMSPKVAKSFYGKKLTEYTKERKKAGL
ncbi:DUF4369 domain-containing protein [Flavobacterium sp. 3HN19-14]|uniref:DUF4369 domain-containing protein n=1 Tax=Flavobacterium sp. 3HN19-14 TaxID=3448133 RepID=UPI003EDFF730